MFKKWTHKKAQSLFFHNKFQEASTLIQKFDEGKDAKLLYTDFQRFASKTLESLMTFDQNIMAETLVLADKVWFCKIRNKIKKYYSQQRNSTRNHLV